MLGEIAYKYGTDKCPQIKHHFTDWYDAEFGLRRETIQRVLEIGIGGPNSGTVHGASLRMWQEYFPNAMITGVDIDPDLLFEDKRIRTAQCDTHLGADINRILRVFGKQFDLVIDDGDHKSAWQEWTCGNFIKKLAPPFVYVIEDAGFTNPENIKLPKGMTIEEWKPRHRKYRDDRLIIVRAP